MPGLGPLKGRGCMSKHEETLLAATDTKRRLLQHGAMLGGVALLVAAGVLVNMPDSLSVTLAAILLGLVLFIVAAGIKQRWEVSHKGHPIRFENNPILGEKLFIDGELVARGKLGYRSETRGDIKAGDGVGDQIIARSEAGFLDFRCRITVEPAEGLRDMVPEKASDERLLEEVRRRGLHLDKQ